MPLRARIFHLWVKKKPKNLSAAKVIALVFAAIILLGTCLLTAFAPTAIREVSHAPAIQYFYLAVLGVCSSAVAYVSWAKAFSKAKKTSQVSNYMFLTPFLTSILGFLLAGEVPDRATLAGGSIILTGVLLFNFGGKLFMKKPDL